MLNGYSGTVMRKHDLSISFLLDCSEKWIKGCFGGWQVAVEALLDAAREYNG